MGSSALNVLPYIQRRRLRTGAAAVECAVVIPVLLLIVIAVVDVNAIIYLKQACKLACYEGCRVGIVPGANTENVQAQVQEILTDRRIKEFAIEMSPSDPQQLTSGEYFTVRVRVNASANLFFATWLGRSNMACDVTMRSEL